MPCVLDGTGYVDMLRQVVCDAFAGVLDLRMASAGLNGTGKIIQIAKFQQVQERLDGKKRRGPGDAISLLMPASE